ncbi:MAG: hypothetical protein ILA06_02140 [Bacteroidaceae bacterium]|nr:hypothetical protein [Bacteroidaceae bacterium]
MKKNYSKPFMAVEVFEPQQFIAACDPETMYTIKPADTSGITSSHMYMEGSTCQEAQGPVTPNQQAITVSADAMPRVMELIRGGQLWSIGNKEGNRYSPVTDFIYNSIATSSNSFGGHITGDNVNTFHATICGDNASQNAIFVFNGGADIVKNLS